MTKRIVLLLSLICIPFISISAAGPPKIENLLPHPLQAFIRADFEESSAHAWSEFMVEDGKTAVIEYISCRMVHSVSGSDNAFYQLWADLDDGSTSYLMLDSDMSPERYYGQGSGPNSEVSANFVSTCIGARCDSLNGDKFVSLTLRASRNKWGQDEPRDEHIDCVITGYTD